MADISQYLKDILDARYGEEVRGSIHDAIEKINSTSDEAVNDANEALERANGFIGAAEEAREAATAANNAADKANTAANNLDQNIEDEINERLVDITEGTKAANEAALEAKRATENLAKALPEQTYQIVQIGYVNASPKSDIRSSQQGIVSANLKLNYVQYETGGYRVLVYDVKPMYKNLFDTQTDNNNTIKCNVNYIGFTVNEINSIDDLTMVDINNQTSDFQYGAYDEIWLNAFVSNTGTDTISTVFLDVVFKYVVYKQVNYSVTGGNNLTDIIEEAKSQMEIVEKAIKDANSASSAANSSASLADTATQNANTAASNANDAAKNVNDAVDRVDSAVENANKAVIDAQSAVDSANQAVENANVAIQGANEASSNAISASTTATEAASNANTAASSANSAAANAESVASGLDTRISDLESKIDNFDSGLSQEDKNYIITFKSYYSIWPNIVSNAPEYSDNNENLDPSFLDVLRPIFDYTEFDNGKYWTCYSSNGSVYNNLRKVSLDSITIPSNNGYIIAHDIPLNTTTPDIIVNASFDDPNLLIYFYSKVDKIYQTIYENPVCTIKIINRSSSSISGSTLKNKKLYITRLQLIRFNR